MPKELRNLRIIAEAPNVGDFLQVLEDERSNVSDIRKAIAKRAGGQDSVEIRQAVDFILTALIDRIKKARDSKQQRGRNNDIEEGVGPNGSQRTSDDDLL